MQAERHEPIIIELDDPHPRWYPYLVALGGVLMIVLMVAPFFLSADPAPETDASQFQPNQVQAARVSVSVCQTSVDIPAFAQPVASMVIPGWMRICDWFAEPPPSPAEPPAVPELPPSRVD